MQTFLPFPDFKQSALSIDKKRCWKQVVEAKQLLCSLNAKNLPIDWTETNSFKRKTYQNHPAAKMWVGSEELLKEYYNAFLKVSLDVHKINTSMPFLDSEKTDIKPFWLGDDNFHRSHRSRLIEKNTDFYLPKYPKDKNFNNCKYLWPNLKTKKYELI